MKTSNKITVLILFFAFALLINGCVTTESYTELSDELSAEEEIEKAEVEEGIDEEEYIDEEEGLDETSPRRRSSGSDTRLCTSEQISRRRRSNSDFAPASEAVSYPQP